MRSATPTRGPPPASRAARSRSRSTSTAPCSPRARSTLRASSSPCSPPRSGGADERVAPRLPRQGQRRADGDRGRPHGRLADRARRGRGVPLLRPHLHDRLLPPPDRPPPDRFQGPAAAGEGRPPRRRPRPPDRRERRSGRRGRRPPDRSRGRPAPRRLADLHLQGGRRGDRLQDPDRRCLVPLLRRPRAQARRLLLAQPQADQRRRLPDRLLLQGPPRLLRHVLPDEGEVLTLVFALAALAAGITGAWSPCGFSMVETLAPAGYAGRLRTTLIACTTFTAGALAGGGVTFGGLSLLGAALGAGAPAVAALIALAAAAGEARGTRIVPQVRRQVPEAWRRRLPVPLAAGLYGVLLGLGFTTFILTFAVWALAGVCVAVGDPALGAAVGLAFGAGRLLPVIVLAPAGESEWGAAAHAAMAERPRILRSLRAVDAVAL